MYSDLFVHLFVYSVVPCRPCILVWKNDGAPERAGHAKNHPGSHATKTNKNRK